MTSDPNQTLKARKALLVDDDAALRGLLFVLLKQMGFEATCAQNAYEAIDIIETEGSDNFHVLITDIRMPGMDGFELARRIRSGGSSIPILFISGYTSSMGTIEEQLDEQSAFLKKPFSFTVFSQALERLLPRAVSRENKITPPPPRTRMPAMAIRTKVRGVV